MRSVLFVLTWPTAGMMQAELQTDLAGAVVTATGAETEQSVNPFAATAADAPAYTETICCCSSVEESFGKYLCIDTSDQESDVLTPVLSKKALKGENPFAPKSINTTTVDRTMTVTTEVFGECTADGKSSLFAAPEKRETTLRERQKKLLTFRDGSRVEWKHYTVTSSYKTKKGEKLVEVGDIVYRRVGTDEKALRQQEAFGEGKAYCTRKSDFPVVTLKRTKRIKDTAKSKWGTARAAALPSYEANPFAAGAARQPFAATAEAFTTAAPGTAGREPTWRAETQCKLQSAVKDAPCLEWSVGYACGFNEPVGELYKRVGRKGECVAPHKEGTYDVCPRKDLYHKSKTGTFGYNGWQFCDCTDSRAQIPLGTGKCK